MDKKKKKLYMAIDPGYDQFKILVRFENCIANYAFPSQITPADTSHKGLSLTKGNFYIFAEDDGAYLCGDAAERELISTTAVTKNLELLGINKGIERFSSINFKYSLEGAIAYSLYQFEITAAGQKSGFNVDALNSYDICIGVALPHDLLDSDASTVAGYIRCKHNFHYQHAGFMEKTAFNFDLSNVPVIFNSQAVLAFDSYAMDDDGYDIPDLVRELPCIVYDAGFKTVGRFALTMNKELQDAESNMDYAMYNAYEATIQRVNKATGGNFQAYQVPIYIKHERTFKKGVNIVDPAPIFEEEFEKLQEAACNDLMNKWDDYLNESELLLIAGGTGTAYYDYFKTTINKHYPGIKVKLANGIYNDYEYGSIYSIAIGLMKFMDSEEI